jgi:hypothetical protein
MTSTGFIVDFWLYGSIIILLGNSGFGTFVVIGEKGFFFFKRYYLCVPWFACLFVHLGISLCFFPTITH